MEYGPRALGARSIIADPRSPEMQKKLNLDIKFRESFRPFAPAMLPEEAERLFDLGNESPYMLLVDTIKEEHRKELPGNYMELPMMEKLYHLRSNLPAATHVDFSARVQTVHEETNSKFHLLLTKFKEQTGVGVLLNTSFNVRGEPIVCTLQDGYDCFMHTGLDYLVAGNYIFKKDKGQKTKD